MYIPCMQSKMAFEFLFVYAADLFVFPITSSACMCKLFGQPWYVQESILAIISPTNVARPDSINSLVYFSKTLKSSSG